MLLDCYEILFYKVSRESKIGIEFTGLSNPKITKVKNFNNLIKKNDILYKINNKLVTSPRHATELLDTSGLHIISILRNNKCITKGIPVAINLN